MEFALIALALVGTVVAVTSGCRRFGLSSPLILTAIGAAASFLPFMPEVRIDPHIILLGFLPPLLYAAAISTSLIDLGRNRVPIVVLSVFLVVATAFAVGGVAWALLAAEPFALALALGGVVAPPDAVAATAVARRIGLPRRVVNLLEGESLFNDATALVIVSMSITAFTTVVTPVDVGERFLLASVGGIVIGWLASRLIRWVRQHIKDTTTNVALSFMAPWIAYLPAEAIESSGVIATVVCGVLLAHTAATEETASARLAQRLNWATMQYVLENLVFLLIGLQVATILSDVQRSELGTGQTLIVAVAVLATCLVVRPIWFMAWALIDRLRGSEGALTPRQGLIASWAGMRGVVTLAGASLLPTDAPERAALVFTALLVTVGTLALQGFTLGRVAHALNLHGPDPREDALQYAQTLQMAVNAGRHRLDEEVAANPGAIPEEIVSALHSQGERRANLAWERLGRSGPDTETPGDTYRRLRTDMLTTERTKVLKLRNKGVIDHEVIEDIMAGLDIEESMIARAESRQNLVSDHVLLTPEERQFGCEHLAQAPFAVDPQTTDICPDCVREGLQWVHLRLCLSCGYVGCCDSSIGKHSSKHFEQTGHPVMRSFEPGEAWRWCYVDSLLG